MASPSSTSRKRQRARERTARRKQWQQAFDEWFDYMAGALDEFFECLPADVRDKLDFSVDSLDVLEAFLLERYPDVVHTRPHSETLKADQATRLPDVRGLRPLPG